MNADVPSPIDFRSPEDAAEWSRTANLRRPYREVVFETIASVLSASRTRVVDVLELASGPGHLAEILLGDSESMRMVLLDYSPAMHELARSRLKDHLSRIRFVEQDLKQPGWQAGLGMFDAVITNQAVHELRHKRHAPALHAQVKEILNRDGIYLVCDHFLGEGGMQDESLFMTVDEQREALQEAGFEAELVAQAGSLALHKARVRTE